MERCRLWTFQQDSEILHFTSVYQESLKKHVPRFLSTTEWPSKSLNANPVDYNARNTLQSEAGIKKNIKMFIIFSKCLVLHEACSDFIGCLKTIMRAKDVLFNQKLIDSKTSLNFFLLKIILEVTYLPTIATYFNIHIMFTSFDN